MKTFTFALLALVLTATAAEARSTKQKPVARRPAKYGDLTWPEIQALQQSLRDQVNSSRSRVSGSSHALTKDQQRAINDAVLQQRILSGGR